MNLPQYPKYKNGGPEWLGQVPEHWEIPRFRRGFQESQEKIENDVVGEMLSVSGYRGIEIKEYDDENRRRLDEDLVGYRIVRRGQLVVNTMWLNYAGLGVASFEGHVSPAYRSYWITDGFDGRFVHHLMRSDCYVKGYTRLLTGIRPNSLQMSRDDLMEFPILRPPLREQVEIAAFLDHETAKIDALVEEQRRLIELLEEKRQTVISHAITKGLNPAVPMKPSGIEWLGDVPAHWRFGPLKRFAEVIDCKHHTVEFKDEGFPVVSIRELEGDTINLDDAKRTSEQEWHFLREGRVPRAGDLIFCRNASVGAVGAVRPGMEFCMGQDVCLIRPAEPDGFAHYSLSSSITRSQIEALLIGATIRRLNVEAIRNLVVAQPSQSERLQIAAHLDEVSRETGDLIAEANHATDLLQERRSALISAAVTGKIDVRNTVPEFVA